MEDSSNQNPDILEAALDQAFTAPPRPEVRPENTHRETATTQDVHEDRVSEIFSDSVVSEESWKAEYEVQVQSWRARSAEEREKAEKERSRWEAIRAIEKAEVARRKAAGIIDEPVLSALQPQLEENWENVPSRSSPIAGSTALKSGGLTDSGGDPVHPTPSSTLPEPAPQLPRTHSHQDTTTDEFQKWEDVPSVASSFPSMSFPEHNNTPPPHPKPASHQPPVSVTLAIFDSSLSTRTRLAAALSSLAINLLLPFVNGVMLGFGEIFAKNVVMDWLGRKPSGPGSSAANVGIRSSPREQRQKQNAFQ